MIFCVCLILLYFSAILSSHFIKGKHQQLPPRKPSPPPFPSCSVVPHFVCLHFIVRSGKATLRPRLQSESSCCCLRRGRLCMHTFSLWDSHLHLLAPTHDKHQCSARVAVQEFLLCRVIPPFNVAICFFL